MSAVEDWVLLLELESHTEAGMCWWDAGCVQMVIRRSDLAARRFDRVFAQLITL